MKLIDNKGRIFGKINIVDFCLVLAIIIAVGIFFAKPIISRKEKAGQEAAKTPVSITYQVKVKGVRDATLNALLEYKDKSIKVYDTKEDLSLTLTELVSEDSRGIITDKNGTHLEVVSPGRYDLILTLDTEGTESKAGIYLNGKKKLLIGQTIGLHADLFETSGEIISIVTEEK